MAASDCGTTGENNYQFFIHEPQYEGKYDGKLLAWRK